MKKVAILVVLFFSISIITASMVMGQAKPAPAKPAPAAKSPAGSKEPIKIGFGMALTGGLSANGKPALLVATKDSLEAWQVEKK